MAAMDPREFSACLCTPHASALSAGAAYVRSVRRQIVELEKRNARVEFADEIPDPIRVTIGESLTLEQDLIRTRSRIMRLFLERAKSEWMWWQDDDVSLDDVPAFVTMLTLGVQCGLDAIGAIVVRKHFHEDELVKNVEWALKVKHRYETPLWSVEVPKEGVHDPGAIIRRPQPPPKVEPQSPEAEADYKRAKEVLAHPLRFAFGKDSFAFRKIVPRPDYREPHTAVWRTDQIGMGCVLMRRSAVKRFLSWFERERPGRVVHDAILPPKTAATFLVDIDENQDLLSEDNSMWRLWGEAGLQLFAYIGPGADRFVHTGTYPFSADLTCLFGGPAHVGPKGEKR